MRCLLYLDPSPRGEWAIALARLLPAECLESLTFLATAEDAAARPDWIDSARAALGESGARAREALRPGPAERAVAAEAKANVYDFVIVPPAGRNAIQRMLKGSRVGTIVRELPASVLVARRPPPAIRTILAAVSGGDATETVVALADGLRRQLGCNILYIHVASGVAAPGAAPGGARASLDTIHGCLRKTGMNNTLVVREGFVVDEVLAEMDAGAHDLLIVGAPGAGAADGPAWARENVVERILLNCPAPVWVARGGAG